ncbi:MAG: hypothetical protein ABDH18_03530, partial [Aquificaceae bacterium]
LSIAIISTVASALGITLSYLMSFTSMSAISDKTAELSRVFRGQFYTEYLYHKILATGFRDLSLIFHYLLERFLIDGFLNFISRLYLPAVSIVWKALDQKFFDRLAILSASSSSSFGKRLSALQNGLVNSYVIMLAVGLVILIGLITRWRV